MSCLSSTKGNCSGQEFSNGLAQPITKVWPSSWEFSTYTMFFHMSHIRKAVLKCYQAGLRFFFSMSSSTSCHPVRAQRRLLRQYQYWLQNVNSHVCCLKYIKWVFEVTKNIQNGAKWPLTTDHHFVCSIYKTVCLTNRISFDILSLTSSSSLLK